MVASYGNQVVASPLDRFAPLPHGPFGSRYQSW